MQALRKIRKKREIWEFENQRKFFNAILCTHCTPFQEEMDTKTTHILPQRVNAVITFMTKF